METVVTADDDLTGRSRGSVASTISRLKESWLAPSSNVPTWFGVVVAALGFVLIAYGWGRVAALLSVPLQMPYVISAGFTGLGLICVGIGIVAVQAKRQETAAREVQLEEIRNLIERLDQHVTGSPAGRGEQRGDLR